MRRLAFTKPLFMLLLLAGLSQSCLFDNGTPGNKEPLLVREVYYIESKINKPYGEKTYQYDRQKRLVRTVENNQTTTEISYDRLSRIIRKSIQYLDSDGIPNYTTTATFEYPSPYIEHETQIGNDGTMDHKHIRTYNTSHQMIQEDKYFTREVYINSNSYDLETTTVVNLITSTTFGYYSNGNIKYAAEKHTAYRYMRDEVKSVTTLTQYYDEYGNETSSTFEKADGTLTSTVDYLNEYQNGLLVSKTFIPFNTTWRYEYDEKGRLLRAFDGQGYLLIENFYDEFKLVESNAYVPDGYDGIPDQLIITEYLYKP